MQLSTLLEKFAHIPNVLDLEINGLSLDSRHIEPGNLFIAIQGTQTDGNQFISKALANGAQAVITDNDQIQNATQSIPIIFIPELRKKLSLIAREFYQYPDKSLQLLGVTGTNGKTSCTHFIAQLLSAKDISCGIMGTLGNGFFHHLGEAGLTTPDPITLQATFKEFKEQSTKVIAMEVSSHSIDQNRIQDLTFEVGVFTNLSQDHLDYHVTMENYAAVKKRFLTESLTKKLVINADDSYGEKWIKELKNEKTVVSYGIDMPAMVSAHHIQLGLNGIQAQITTPWGDAEILLPLIGRFNLSNVLAVISTLCLMELPFSDVIDALPKLEPVPGRMQTLGGNQKPLVIIDYSHTPDALKKALSALRVHLRGKLWCVFGCGGNRDHGKRPQMAQIAEELADHVIVTNDNPRHEDPETILSDIMAGFKDKTKVRVELNRSKAIENSIQWASVTDCILIAGKGAELYQQIGDEKYPFNDATCAREALAQHFE